jgi:drug/metabolite transporter (DMT)-like permease
MVRVRRGRAGVAARPSFRRHTRNMTHHVLGQLFALLAALTWAIALVLFKHSGKRVAPIALNLFKNSVGLGLLLVSLAVLVATGQDSLDSLRVLRFDEICLLMASGILGIALADTIFFFALNLINVGLISIVDCLYSPFVILLSWWILKEKLTAFHIAGAVLIIAGVFLSSRHSVPVNRTRGQMVLGMVLAGGAVWMMAFGIVIAKPILEDVGLIWATSLRMVAGSFLLALFALLGRNWKAHWIVFRPTTTWKYAIPASILGTYLAMVFWVAGFKYTDAAVAGVLNQTSVIFASVLAAVFLKERFGLRQIIAIVLAITGVVTLTLGPPLVEWLRKAALT